MHRLMYSSGSYFSLFSKTGQIVTQGTVASQKRSRNAEPYSSFCRLSSGHDPGGLLAAPGRSRAGFKAHTVLCAVCNL